jgi:hypothetical protein
MITSQVSLNTGRAGVHIAAIRVRAHVVGIDFFGSGAEVLVLSLLQWLDRSTGADRRVEGADKVLRV